MAWSSFKIWSFMALRFILRHKRKTVATSSFIILGTMVLVFLHGLTVGINDTMVLNSTRLHYGDAFIQFPAGYKNPERYPKLIKAAAPVREALFRSRFSALAMSDLGQAPMVIYAVHPDAEAPTTAIANRILNGAYPQTIKREVLLGANTAEQLQVTVGDTISILMGTGVWLEPYRVCGIFQTEIPHFDNTIAYVPLHSLDPALRAQSQKEVAVFLDSQKDLKSIRTALSGVLPVEIAVQPWQMLMPDLQQLIEMNEIAMQIIILFVFVLVGFGISNNFILTIVERFREFGILKAMGVTPRELVGLIFMESFLVCLVATLLGLFFGWVLIQIFAQVGIDFSSLTSHNRYFVVTGLVKPRAVTASFFWPGILSLIISIISSYLPTRIAARKAASETLRYT
jgi:ABC-type lipoprotein release transport system permease subunit